MGVRKYSGRGQTFGPKRGILWMDISNCCNEPGSNQSCKEVRTKTPKSLNPTTVKSSTPTEKEERGK
jgi:hypothetical protein